jgi:dinuclear metal center YbgI/SA1388 family protein
MGVLFSEIVAAMEAIAPTSNAESWDNVGMLCGDPDHEVSRGMICIDLTQEVLDEAIGKKCDFVIAYHPVIFEGLKRVNAGSVAHRAIARGIDVYCPHTAWDVVEGGVNDFLMEMMGVKNARVLRKTAAKTTQYKVVAFVPFEATERVAGAMFGAGAGRIGEYSRCSFRVEGAGTFMGSEKSHPAVGKKMIYETVGENRVEMVVKASVLEGVLSAMKKAHPYEEPVFDVIPLFNANDAGQGRIGELEKATERREVLRRISAGLGVRHLLVAGPRAGKIGRVACLAGSGGEFLKDAMEQKAELYLTGEMRHHDALKAAERGMTVVCALHSNSERASLRRMARMLKKRVKVEVVMSARDRDPFEIM